MEVILVKLISGELVVGERTETGIKFPIIVTIAGEMFGFFNYHQGLAKNNKTVSREVEISEDKFMCPPVKPLGDIEMRYRENKSGIKNVGKPKLVDATGQKIRN